jgi:hypothetical protein
MIWFNSKSSSSVPDYIKEQTRMLSEGLPSSTENFNFQVPAGATPAVAVPAGTGMVGAAAVAPKNIFSKIAYYFCADASSIESRFPGGFKDLITICDICQDDKVIATTNLPQEKQAKIKEIFALVKNQIDDPAKTQNLDRWRVGAAFSNILGVLIAFITGGNTNINDPEINAKLETVSILKFYNDQAVISFSAQLAVGQPVKDIMYYNKDDNTVRFNNYQYRLTISKFGAPTPPGQDAGNWGSDTYEPRSPAQFRTFALSFFTQEQIRNSVIEALNSIYNRINTVFVTNKVFLQKPTTCNVNLFSRVQDIIDQTAF